MFVSTCSGFACYYLQEQNLRPEMQDKHMQLSIQNPFSTLHSLQEAILILRYLSISFGPIISSFHFYCLYILFVCYQVRVYTAKRVFQELETAKEEYIRATFGVRKDQKILLPKIVESFAKDSGLCQAGVLKMIQQCLPESLRKSINNCQQVKSRKIVEWVPHNFAFRYLVLKEVVK